MFFAFVCLFAISWVGWACYIVTGKQTMEHTAQMKNISKPIPKEQDTNSFHTTKEQNLTTYVIKKKTDSKA